MGSQVGSGAGGGGGRGAGDVRAGGAFYELSARDKFTAVLEKAREKARAFGDFMKSFAARTAVAGGVMAAPLVALFKGGFDRAAGAEKLARQMEIPIAAADRLRQAADAAGVSIDEVLHDTSGKYDQFVRAAQPIDPKQARQAAEAQRQFASATVALQNALLPLLDVITPYVRKLTEFARANSDVLRPLAVVAATLLAVSAAAAVAGPGVSLLVGGLGVLAKAAAFGGGALWSVLKVLTAVRTAMVLTAVKAVALAGVKLVWAVATGSVSAAVTILGGAVSFLLTPVGLLAVAALGLAYILKDPLRAAIGDVGAAFKAMGEIFGETWTAVVDAVKAGDLELAFRAVSQGVRALWAQLLSALAQAWNNFVQRVGESVKKNKWLMAAVGGVGGAAAGLWVGGPLGALLGGVGGAAAGLAAGEFAGDIADKLKVDVAPLAAAAAREREKLGAIGKEAAAAAARPDLAYLEQQQRARPFDAVKGAFATFGTARGQFGYSSQTSRMNALLANIVDGNGKLPEKIGNAVAGQLNMK